MQIRQNVATPIFWNTGFSQFYLWRIKFLQKFTCRLLDILAFVFESTGGPRTRPDAPFFKFPKLKPRSS